MSFNRVHKVQPIGQRLFATGIVRVLVATLIRIIWCVLAKYVRIACEQKFSTPVSSRASSLRQNTEMITRSVWSYFKCDGSLLAGKSLALSSCRDCGSAWRSAQGQNEKSGCTVDSEKVGHVFRCARSCSGHYHVTRRHGRGSIGFLWSLQSKLLLVGWWLSAERQHITYLVSCKVALKFASRFLIFSAVIIKI